MFDFFIHVISLGGIYALIALALNIQAGDAGLLNFGHIALVGVGAYAIGMGSMWGISPLISAPLGIGLAVLLGIAMAIMGRQLAKDYWGIATLAIAEIVRIIVMNDDSLTGGSQGIGNIELSGLSDSPASKWIFLVLIVVVLIGVTGLCLRLQKSRFGRALRLMREEPQLATCLGYNLHHLKRSALILSAIISAIAGILLAFYTSYVSPDYLRSSETFLIWSMVMIGGIGSVSGVLIGAFSVQILYSFIPFAKDFFAISSDMSGALQLGLVGVILLGCLLKKPDGLFPERLRILP